MNARTMKTIDLRGRWKFRAVDKYGLLPDENRSVTQWMNGTVPGTVHTDLLANHKIPDPFYRMNELDVQWIESQQWLYCREFVVPAAMLKEETVYLVAEGLDTYARIWCNGRKVGDTANMFVEHRLDIKSHMRAGMNSIEILFDSPISRAMAVGKKHRMPRGVLEPWRVHVRKAQYSFGWDWGPKLTTSGIWRNISIQSFSFGRLCHPFLRVISVDNQEAVLKVSLEVERVRRLSFTLRTFIVGAGSVTKHTIPVSRNRVEFTVQVPRPHLWWPNGWGDQPMYTATFLLLYKQEEIHRLRVSFAIRTVRLLREKDADGESFIFEINGKKVFCKGANWVPADSFIPRIPKAKYETLLRMAKDAHMNMIRVWGGGIYEQDIFYELCDSLGLMVWQDFMYACGEYPSQPHFLGQAKDEAEEVVKRLRNHPSIVLWCGNNECEWGFCTEHQDKTPDDMRGAKIFRDILPKVCAQHDGTRPYWRSSPFGGRDPNAETRGNHHEWTVWTSWSDFKEYEKDDARFVTEFGFQAPANRRTFERVTTRSDRHPQSKVVEHHNKQAEGMERLFRFQSAHYRINESFDEFIFRGQLVQAEALKCGVEHWRRRKFATGGALFWQFNDCWPVTSWAVIDSALRPKAAYYFAKKFFAPVLLSFRQTAMGIEVWVTSDLTVRETGKLVLSLCSFRGRKWSTSQVITISPNSSKAFCRIDHTKYARYDRSKHYIHAQLSVNGTPFSENRFFFDEPKHLQLPKARVSTTLRPLGEAHFALTIRASSFAKNVWAEVEGEDVVFDDNYFDIDAGRSKDIIFRSRNKISYLRRNLRVRWL